MFEVWIWNYGHPAFPFPYRIRRLTEREQFELSRQGPQRRREGTPLAGRPDSRSGVWNGEVWKVKVGAVEEETLGFRQTCP